MGLKSQVRVGDTIKIGEFTSIRIIESYGNSCRVEIDGPEIISFVRKPYDEKDNTKRITKGFFDPSTRHSEEN